MVWFPASPTGNSSHLARSGFYSECRFWKSLLIATFSKPQEVPIVDQILDRSVSMA